MAKAKREKREKKALRLELKNLQQEIKKLLELDCFPYMAELLAGSASPVIDEAKG